jgi:hypothetical protein
LHLQGADFVGGLVFREYVDLKLLNSEPNSGRPLAHEYRIFFLHGQPILTVRYWDMPDDGESADPKPPVQRFVPIARRVNSHFFTMDIAQRDNGEWIIIELGDGQVARLPQDASCEAFYRALTHAK